MMTRLERRGDVSGSRAGPGGTPTRERGHRGCGEHGDAGAGAFWAFSGDPSLLSAHLR